MEEDGTAFDRAWSDLDPGDLEPLWRLDDTRLLRQAAVAQQIDRLLGIRLSLVAEAESRELCDRDGWSVANTWSTSNPKPSGPRGPRCCWPDSLAQRRGDALVHHMVAWWPGGSTSLTNGVLLCPHHHRTVEPDPRAPADARWQIRLEHHRLPEPVPPTRFDPARRARQHQRFAERRIVGDD